MTNFVVPANASVRQYWSATVYDRATHALIRDVLRPTRSAQSQGIQKNAEGSVDVYFFPTAPEASYQTARRNHGPGVDPEPSEEVSQCGSEE
jgi:hypothetical protein